MLRECLFSVQWLIASLCGLYCVHGLRGVSSLCHIACCQGQSVTVYGFRSLEVVDFLPSPFLLYIASSFSLSFLFGHLISFVRLPDYGSHFSFNIGIVFNTFFIILPQAFVFSFFLSLPFCHRHLYSIYFSATLKLV